MRTFQIFDQYWICFFYLKSRRKQLQHNYVIILMVTKVYLKNFNQRLNVITVQSSETALVRVHNDILKAVDDNKSVIII